MTSPRPPAAPIGPTAILSAAFTIGAVLLVAPLVWATVPITRLAAPLVDHHQTAETLVYLLAFVLLLPLGTWGGARIADRLAQGDDRGHLEVTAAGLCTGLAVVVLLVRLSTAAPWGGGPGTLATAIGIWWIVAALAVLRPVARRSGPAPATVALAWRLAALSVVPVALAFTDLSTISVPVLIVGGVATGAVMAITPGGRTRGASPRGGAALDLALIGALLLAVPNLAIFSSSGPLGAGFEITVLQFHQNFYLGPANQILAGDAMLVDVLSQYGVGSIYFLAAVFTVLPIGNGMLGLVEGVLSALVFVGTYATLRIAGVSRLLAGLAMTVGVVALVYGLRYPIGGLLQHGAIRFGPPVGVVVGAVAEARWPHWRRPARALQLVTFAVASMWALEAFAYTTLTLLAVAGLAVAAGPVGARRREAARWAGQIALAGGSAHVVLAGATWLATGELPEWGWYLHTLREFLLGDLSDLTYDFTSFSPAYAVGAIYLASASGVALLVARRRDVLRSQLPAITAITAITAHGIALFSYVVNRGSDHIIPYVCLPAIAVVVLWVDLVGRPPLDAPPRLSRAALGLSLLIATLLVAAAWPAVPTRFSESALAHVIPGGPPLRAALDDLRQPPPLRASAATGERLLADHLPGEDRSIVLTSADLSVEILMRSARGSRIPLGDPWEDSFVADQHLDAMGAFVDELAAGDRILLDQAAVDAFDRYRRDPSVDPLQDDGGFSLVPDGLASLQRWVLSGIGERFDLRSVASLDGLEVVELIPRG